MSATSHLLDTSVYSQPLRPIPLPAVEQHWRALGDRALCISALCEAELLQGLEQRDSERLWRAYRDLLENRLPCLPVDRDTAIVYARLAAAQNKKGRPRPVVDLLIAASALEHQLVIATCNPRHFLDIDGLTVEDWSQP